MTENNQVAPLWFDVDRLKQTQFNAEEYIAELRRYVPLESISSQLETYLSQLKLELVEVINEKYNDFVGLAGRLSGVEGAITRIKKPLLSLMVKLEVVERGLNSELQLLLLSLDHRQKLVNARRQLELMQNAFQISMKIEKLIDEVETTTQDGLLMTTSLLERLAQEVGRLDLLLGDESQLELIGHLSKQNVEFKKKVKNQLKGCLAKAFELKNPDHGSVLRILSSFNVVGASAEGELIIKQSLIHPLFSSLHDQRDLRLFLEEVANQVFELYGGVLPVLLRSTPGLQNYSFLGNCVVSSVYEEIKKTRSSVYSPGNPDAFLQNYKASVQFIEQLENHCPTRAAMEQFRSNETVKQFLKDWNLAVYFAMRFQEIAGHLDVVLVEDRSPLKSKSTGNVVETWIDCLRMCFASNIFAAQLNDQFLKLFFKMLSRFENWLKSNLDSIEKQGQSNLGSFPRTNEDIALLEKDLLAAEILRKESFFLQAMTKECGEEVKKLVDVFLGRLEEIREDLAQLIIRRLVTDCAAIVKKSVNTAVSTMFRPSGDHQTQANDYVKRLLDPLKFFLESNHPQEELKMKVKIGVARGVCSAYRQALVDILSFWEKSRTSLLRINKSRLSSTDAAQMEGSNTTELANVYQQHWLDVSAFGQVLHEYNLPPIEEYTELKDLIISKREEISS